MNCPAPLPEEAQTPQLEALLVEKPYVVPVNKKKEPEKKREGLLIQDPSDTRSEDTRVSSVHEEEEYKEEEEDEGEREATSPKRKRAASEDPEEDDPPRPYRRFWKAFTAQPNKPSAPVEFSEDVVPSPCRERPPPRRYSI